MINNTKKIERLLRHHFVHFNKNNNFLYRFCLTKFIRLKVQVGELNENTKQIAKK
jgi:hypothetical protein